jgi:hypothetical protein
MYVSLRTSSFTNNCENKKKQEAQVRNNNKYTSMGSATQEMDGIPVSPRVGMYN